MTIISLRNRTLALEGDVASIWSVCPFQLVSLLEMLEHNANLFYFTTRKLAWLQTKIARAIKERGSSSLPNKDEADDTRRVLKRIERECEKLESFSDVLERLDNFDDGELMQPLIGPPFTLDLLRRELEEVSRAIAKGLSQNRFMMIPPNRTGYYAQRELFGPLVYEKFSGARSDIKEAGNCFAAGNNTACIFHLMRVLEHGLRSLAKKLKVNFPRNPKTPAEFRTWGEILMAIGNAINALPNPKTRKQASDSEFYNADAAQFHFFKDAWRNVVMHSRSVPYDEHQAMSVMIHVREFMKHLATRLKE